MFLRIPTANLPNHRVEHIRLLNKTCIFSMMALLLELVEPPAMIAPPTSPTVGVTVQRKHLGV